MAKLTKRTVDALKPKTKPKTKAYLAYDGELPGFGVRVMPTGHKSFIIEYRPHGGGRGVATKRLTLGAYGALTVEQARREAIQVLARVRLGADPQQEKLAKRAAASVVDLIDAFIAGHVEKHCKPGTGDGYKIALAHLRRAHGTMKAAALTRGQVAALHSRLSEHTAGGGGPYAANRFLAIVSKLYAWGIDHGLLPDDHVNPARRIKKNRSSATNGS